ncbi:galactose ABC transporter substrate-binding protein [Klebsiella pneumoniae]|uniref:D-galactose/methyl-galactoside binding periplasmic protein MglB n=1 Tax=Klebsiella pneumoniae TaxID=573 RepID=A0A378FWP6_KLEPN|nr:galactose ABC transporter substrate-binding protein [Klebsiella pneumoniae]
MTRLITSGTDSKESGIIQGDLIAKHWKANPNWDLNKDGQIQYVLLKGEPGHPDAEARTTYVIKELNDKGLKTQQLQLDTAMWDTAQAKDKMDAWLSGPNANKIEVVIANNDAMAMGAVEALKAHNKSSIPVFGVDALPEALALVKSGRDGRYCAERCQQPGESDLRAGEKPCRRERRRGRHQLEN